MTMMARRWQTLLCLLVLCVLGSLSLAEEAETCAENGTQEEEKEPCVDDHEDCDGWSREGECEANPAYMKRHCKKSCFVCSDLVIDDLGVKQTVKKGFEEQIEQRLKDAEDYLKNVVAKDRKHRDLVSICKNKKPLCALWAVEGECEKNYAWMSTKCAPVCQTCDQLTLEARCPIDLDRYPNAWEAGDLNEFFTNLTTLEEFKQYSPTVLSRPNLGPGDTEETADYIVDGPWIVTLDNVITEEEAQRLIDLGTKEGYEPSYAGGKVLEDGSWEPGFSETRTSANTWCQGACYDDPVAQEIIARIAKITNIPEENSEFLQLLKYNVGEFYKTHHDYLEYGLDRQCGVRLLTVFLYLNEVEEGGGTEFPDYDLTVTPKLGRALIWPSVRNDNPHKKDGRTMHQALPVLKGIKYGANAWVHMRNFKEPFDNGCN